MKTNINIIKGIHPGAMLDRELKRRSMTKRDFALSINEHPQTIGSIIKGKRRMNIALSLKIEEKFDFEEGYYMLLQTYYDIKIEKLKQCSTPDLSKLRSILFWDSNINSLDWMKYKESIIRRVFERGNRIEKIEISKFYTKEEINKILKTPKNNNYIIYSNNSIK